MKKKYNPQQTKEKILSVSAALFAEKGYDKTSMQDIVNALEMSKGAIFHHFNSKEEVLQAVMAQQFSHVEQEMHQRIAALDGLSAKEKLQSLLEYNLTDGQVFKESSDIAVTMSGSPHLILAVMQGNMKNSAPILAGLLREGIKDGSITVQFPDQCAEVFLLLFNIWCDTYVFAADPPAVRKRFLFVQHLMRQLGADILTDQLLEQSIKFIERLNLEVETWNKHNS